MVTEKTAKELAQRIDPTYFRDPHPLRRVRFLLSLGLFLIAAAWILVAALLGDESAYAAGPLAQGHILLEDDCAKCHTLAFGSVRDSACATCHEAPDQHKIDPRSVQPSKPEVRAFCVTCHSSGIDGIPQVDMRSHNPTYQCWQCHYPHFPETE